MVNVPRMREAMDRMSGMGLKGTWMSNGARWGLRKVCRAPAWRPLWG